MTNGFYAKVIKDSLSPAGSRMTTIEARYPRFIHAEVLTHRQLSRNASSSRAIPSKKIIKGVRENPAMPIHWGLLQPGMQAAQETEHADIAQHFWLKTMNLVADATEIMAGLRPVNKKTYEPCDADCPDAVYINLHKQVANRMLEPWTWMTTIISATEWDNFIGLRTHPDAQPEMRHLAELIVSALESSTPQNLDNLEWHIPYIQDDELSLPLSKRRKISVARCARVSYLTQSGTRDIQSDINLYNRLLSGSDNGHWSPFEHVAQAVKTKKASGNFRGFKQFRKNFKNECIKKPENF